MRIKAVAIYAKSHLEILSSNMDEIICEFVQKNMQAFIKNGK